MKRGGEIGLSFGIVRIAAQCGTRQFDGVVVASLLKAQCAQVQQCRDMFGVVGESRSASSNCPCW
jgi:hypothetical protein